MTQLSPITRFLIFRRGERFENLQESAKEMVTGTNNKEYKCRILQVTAANYDMK